ncbi:MAG TPA: alpha/beta fold hydrolase [Allosphingosinicella sp.]|jgi:predicted dienelactone hydrolase
MIRACSLPLLLLGLLCSGCQTVPNSAAAPATLQLVDTARNRPVPLTLYGRPGPSRPLAIISHGYGAQPGAYSFIANAVAERGYLVAAIDHELPGDAPIPSGGNAYQLRMPNWRIGAQSIGYVVDALRERRMTSARTPVVLIGHSNGGDMAMLFATEQPRLVAAAISLDNRRHPLPRTSRPRICSARSSDQPADPGVLPGAVEQSRLGMQIRQVPVIHNDMWDGATPDQRAAMLDLILSCLPR